MRICSLLPAATEILFALGLGDDVVAVSHECDYPPAALSKPRMTSSSVDPDLMSSREIDELVAKTLTQAGSTYHIDMHVLRTTQPDVIITQELCAVCAVEGTEVRRAAAQLNPPSRILTLEPTRVADVVGCIRAVGEEVGASDRAEVLAEALAARIEVVRVATADLARPRVFCLEWLDPPWVAGHWMPEVVQIAGGSDVLGPAGEPSRRVSWAEVAAAAPDAVILMPCGFGVERTIAELPVLWTIPEIRRIPAFVRGEVYAVDGSSYFNRPGPRIVDGIELLAAIFHPELFSRVLPERAVRKLAASDFGIQDSQKASV
jgi:iron complex transport system substrate-binding protein